MWLKFISIVVIRKIIQQFFCILQIYSDIIPVVICGYFRMCIFNYLKFTADKCYRITDFMRKSGKYQMKVVFI